jgi:hypothetical protein
MHAHAPTSTHTPSTHTRTPKLLSNFENSRRNPDSDDSDFDEEDGGKEVNPFSFMGANMVKNAGKGLAVGETAEDRKRRASEAVGSDGGSDGDSNGEGDANAAMSSEPLSKRQKKLVGKTQDGRADRTSTAPLYPVSVANITNKCKRKHLEGIFSKHAEVASIRLVARALAVGGSGGGGGKGDAGGASEEAAAEVGAYVMFFSQGAANTAKSACDGTDVQGKNIVVRIADGRKFTFCNGRQVRTWVVRGHVCGKGKIQLFFS